MARSCSAAMRPARASSTARLEGSPPPAARSAACRPARILCIQSSWPVSHHSYTTYASFTVGPLCLSGNPLWKTAAPRLVAISTLTASAVTTIHAHAGLYSRLLRFLPVPGGLPSSSGSFHTAVQSCASSASPGLAIISSRSRMASARPLMPSAAALIAAAAEARLIQTPAVSPSTPRACPAVARQRSLRDPTMATARGLRIVRLLIPCRGASTTCPQPRHSTSCRTYLLSAFVTLMSTTSRGMALRMCRSVPPHLGHFSGISA